MSRGSPDNNRSAHTSRTSSGRWPLDWTVLLEVGGIFVVLSAIGIAMGSLAISWSESSPDGLDRTTVEWWEAQRSSTLDPLAHFGSSLADTVVLGTVVTVLFLVLAFVWRRRRGATALGLALGLEVMVFLTVSTVLDRARPDVEQLDPSPPTASFPSGHVGGSVTFALIVAVIVFWNSRNAVWRTLAATAALALPLIVALSRMYQGMHFLTDVLGGILLGAAAAIAAWLVTKRALERMHREDSPA